jgi:hypothetical protein
VGNLSGEGPDKRTIRLLLEAISLKISESDEQLKRRYSCVNEAPKSSDKDDELSAGSGSVKTATPVRPKSSTKDDKLSEPLKKDDKTGPRPSLAEFLFACNDVGSSESGSRKEMFYHARRCLELPIRILIDFWQLAQGYIDHPDRNEGTNQSSWFLDSLRNFCRNMIWRESTFPPNVRQRLLDAFDSPTDSGACFSLGDYRLSTITTPSRIRHTESIVVKDRSEYSKPKDVRLEWRVTSAQNHGWVFRKQGDENHKPLYAKSPTVAFLALYTDLHTLHEGL